MVNRDHHGADSFSLACGVSVCLPSEPEKYSLSMGFFEIFHFSDDGWDNNSGRWPSANEAEAVTSLTTMAEGFIPELKQLLSRYETLSAAAELLKDWERGIRKAEVFMADQNFTAAKTTLLNYRQRLQNPKRWDDPEATARDQIRIDELLAVCDRHLNGGSGDEVC